MNQSEIHPEFKVERYIQPTDYSAMLEKQLLIWERVKRTSDTSVIINTHKPTITLGRRTDPSHILLTKDELKKKGIDLVKVQRGGSVTYHGPGQLVIYIIAKVSRYGGTRKFVEKSIGLMQKIASNYSVDTVVNTEMPGLWTTDENPRKLGAIGFQIKGGVSLHGIALNIDNSLIPFQYIVPCGLTLPVTSLQIESPVNPSYEIVANWVYENFSSIFSH